MVKLKVKVLELLAGRPVAIMNVKTASKMNVHLDERVRISNNGKSIISVIDIATGLLKENEIVVSKEIKSQLQLRKGSSVEVSLATEPISAEYIHKKLKCKRLNQLEITKIINDIVKNALTETEIAYFVSAVYKCGMNIEEIEFLVRAMADVGKKIDFGDDVVDKHSIGGIAGNRTTPLVVSICAAAGLTMPKTSSRAITSAAGTADVMESICKVEFKIKEIRDIVKKTNACFVWGGSLGLSPADDKLIQVERILHLDPEPQLLASILSKKIAIGIDKVVIDIPYGVGAKVDKKSAQKLKKQFEFLGKKFNIKLKAALTDGSQPIGNAIGPYLEIKDIINILGRKENRPLDLEKKAVYLSGEIFELSGKTRKGDGKKLAQEILDSGEAFKKFKQIIKAQKGSIPRKIPIAKFHESMHATKKGKIKSIDNKKMNMMAVLAGSPMDNTAGLYLHKHVKDKVKRGEPLITIHSESKQRLKEAEDYFKRQKPIKY